jgi:predicted Rdx family selenoprotein
MTPFEIHPEDLLEARKETRTTRPDVNAMKLLRRQLREGVLTAYKKIEPRVRDALRERADLGHVAVQVTIDLRPTG